MLMQYLGVLVLATGLRLVNTHHMEPFEPGQCLIDDENDLLLLDVPLWNCTDECRARASCRAINVQHVMAICRLTLSTVGPPGLCTGFDFSCKDTWTLQQLPGCETLNCGPGLKCAVDPQSQNLACLYYECPTPAAISNGMVLGNVKLVNTKIEYMCDIGYTLSGPRTRTCQSTGQWSGTEPSCNSGATATTTPVATTTPAATTTTALTSTTPAATTTTATTTSTTPAATTTTTTTTATTPAATTTTTPTTTTTAATTTSTTQLATTTTTSTTTTPAATTTSTPTTTITAEITSSTSATTRSTTTAATTTSSSTTTTPTTTTTVIDEEMLACVMQSPSQDGPVQLRIHGHCVNVLSDMVLQQKLQVTVTADIDCVAEASDFIYSQALSPRSHVFLNRNDVHNVNFQFVMTYSGWISHSGGPSFIPNISASFKMLP